VAVREAASCGACVAAAPCAGVWRPLCGGWCVALVVVYIGCDAAGPRAALVWRLSVRWRAAAFVWWVGRGVRGGVCRGGGPVLVCGCGPCWRVAALCGGWGVALAVVCDVAAAPCWCVAAAPCWRVAAFVWCCVALVVVCATLVWRQTLAGLVRWVTVLYGALFALALCDARAPPRALSPGGLCCPAVYSS
jgi:hypothetical protein